MTILEFLVEEGVLREPSASVADNLQQTRDYNRSVIQRIVRAAERYKNQETQDLQAKVLAYRHEIDHYEDRLAYDEFFGISSSTNGV